MTALIIAAGAIALIVVGSVVSYNRFVDERQTITSSWSNLDTDLQRGYDLIPNHVDTLRGYAAHERSAFTAVMRARAGALATKSSAADQSGIENQAGGRAGTAPRGQRLIPRPPARAGTSSICSNSWSRRRTSSTRPAASSTATSGHTTGGSNRSRRTSWCSPCARPGPSTSNVDTLARNAGAPRRL